MQTRFHKSSAAVSRISAMTSSSPGRRGREDGAGAARAQAAPADDVLVVCLVPEAGLGRVHVILEEDQDHDHRHHHEPERIWEVRRLLRGGSEDEDGWVY